MSTTQFNKSVSHSEDSDDEIQKEIYPIEFLDDDDDDGVLEYLNEQASCSLARSSPSLPKKSIGQPKKKMKMDNVDVVVVLSVLNDFKKSMEKENETTPPNNDYDWHFCQSIYGGMQRMSGKQKKSFHYAYFNCCISLKLMSNFQ